MNTEQRTFPGFRACRDGERWHCSPHFFDTITMPEGWRPRLVGESVKAHDQYFSCGIGPPVSASGQTRIGQLEYATKVPFITQDPMPMTNEEIAALPEDERIKLVFERSSLLSPTIKNLIQNQPGITMARMFAYQELAKHSNMVFPPEAPKTLAQWADLLMSNAALSPRPAVAESVIAVVRTQAQVRNNPTAFEVEAEREVEWVQVSHERCSRTDRATIPIPWNIALEGEDAVRDYVEEKFDRFCHEGDTQYGDSDYVESLDEDHGSISIESDIEDDIDTWQQDNELGEYAPEEEDEEEDTTQPEPEAITI